MSVGTEGVPPQAEKSDDMGMEEALTGGAGSGAGAVLVVVGSGVAHASLDPQASIFEKPEDVLVAGTGADGVGLAASCDGGAGAERLNAELMLEAGTDVDDFWKVGAAGWGTGADEVSLSKSKRSFDGLGAGLEEVGAGLDAKLKSPKSLLAIGSGLEVGN